LTLKHYDDLETSAVLFDREITWIALTGPDRASWLEGMVSNAVGRLGPGQGSFAAHLTPQGKVLALLRILADEDRFWLLGEAPSTPSVEQLDRLLIMEDAALSDESGSVTAFSLVGRGAAAVVGRLPGFDTLPRAFCDHLKIGTIRAVRTHIGYDLIVETPARAGVLEAIRSAGAIEGDRHLLEVVEVECGTPRAGVDLDASVTLPELGEEAIDYLKGCYIGQEAVAKIKYLGHVNRRFRGLRIEGDLVPGPGPLRRDGREAGRLTRAVRSPGLGVIGLGFLRRGAEVPGTEIEIVRDGMEPIPAVVAELPFIDRSI
jgi:folate-binding protein YgfZ